MKQSRFSKLILTLSLLTGSFFIVAPARAQTDSKSDVPSFKMTGDVALLSNFVEHGLTQTNKDPSLQGAFSFNFGPQFKMGVWGSNVNYQSTEHFLLKLNAELRIQITATTEVKLGYFDNKYFKTTTRDGNTLYLAINTHGYRIRYESNSNWEGTDSASTYYALEKDFDINTDWKWGFGGGYTMQNSTAFSNYFDGRGSLYYKGSSNILYQLSLTGTSSATQFNGQGDFFPYLGASTSF
jgi:uncharacterized protein (TIGR02001 family)